MNVYIPFVVRMDIEYSEAYYLRVTRSQQGKRGIFCKGYSFSSFRPMIKVHNAIRRASMYTVKDVAKRLDLTEHTVRFYTDKGLVPNVARDKNNNRIFDEESINWLRGAKNLKRCGMSVEDIKKYVELSLEGDATIQERYEMVQKQKERVLAQLEEAKLMAEYITSKENHYRSIANHQIEDNMNPASWGSDSSMSNQICPLREEKAAD